jgi:myo-inositol 2-dehydrogenase/D-chiro-inositol 1-dehydrogenase
MRTMRRRTFLTSSAALGGALSILPAARVFGTQANARIKLGVIGCGGRGSWIAGLFAKHGGYEIHAVADYFQEVADACGNVLGVDKARRFSGLGGYKKLIASGVEAVALETPPYCFPDHARAAAEAGLHVYMAKPVAVDVPGTLEIAELGRKATEKKRCFLVDFQVPTDPFNIETLKLVREGAIGKVFMIATSYWTGGFGDPPKTGSVESRLRGLVWVNDTDLGGCHHVNACIHGVDAGMHLAGKLPVCAMGSSAVCRKDPHGDSPDLYTLSFEFEGGLIMNHSGVHTNYPFQVRAVALGQDGSAEIGYTGSAFVRGGSKPYDGGEIVDLYPAGATRNIATFQKCITEGNFSNPTVEPSVRSNLTVILGREASGRRVRLTMEELLREKKRVQPDLSGLIY